MPKMRCQCGEVLNLSPLPNPIGWWVISEHDLERVDGVLDEVGMSLVRQLIRCAHCQHVYVFWDGDTAQHYRPVLHGETRLHWRIWTDARSPEAARILAGRILTRMGREPIDLTVAPYPKNGGHVIDAEVVLVESDPGDILVATLRLAEHVGRQWTLHGSVDDRWSS